MKIGIDLDDTLADTMPAVLKFHNEVYNSGLSEDVASYSDYNDSWPFGHEENLKRFYEFFDHDLHHNAKPAQGAVAAIKELAKNHKLYIITARPADVREQTARWVEKNFPGMIDELYFANLWANDSLSPRQKSEICAELGAEIMIEDRFEHARDCALAGQKVFLLDRPWNQGDLPAGVKRFISWSDVPKTLLSFDKDSLI
jgi:uncharacterized HAD superfamily protein